MRLLFNIRTYLNFNAATKIYTMMILPILTYAGAIKFTYTKTQADRLESLRRRAKIIIGNNHLNYIMNKIQRHGCILIMKCLEKQTNS